MKDKYGRTPITEYTGTKSKFSLLIFSNSTFVIFNIASQDNPGALK